MSSFGANINCKTVSTTGFAGCGVNQTELSTGEPYSEGVIGDIKCRKTGASTWTVQVKCFEGTAGATSTSGWNKLTLSNLA